MYLFSLTATCKLFFSDESCSACPQCECSVSAITAMFFFHVRVFRRSCFVFYPGISIQASVLVDPVTGLSTTTSILEYRAEKEDTDAQFTCSTQHAAGAELASPAVSFSITCESPKCTNIFHWKHFLNCTSRCLQMSCCRANFWTM